ncbi:GTPase, partial [Neisseria sp. P0001.S004]
TRRKSRMSGRLKTFALVGYTNDGKSSLFNRLTKADVLEKDQLFATLDTTARRLFLSHEASVILTYTVGFVRDLPHKLV